MEAMPWNEGGACEGSGFKQKLRERQSQPNQIVHSGIPQKSEDSPLNSTSLDSPDSDRRYVTPPSSVQSHVQHHSRPLSDPQALKKPIDAKSRLPVFRQNRTKNRLSDSPQPKSGEVAASSLPTRSIRSPQPIKNQKNLPSKAPTSSLGSPGTNPPMLPMSRPGGVLVKHPSSLPQPASIQMRSLVDLGGSRPLREISAEVNRTDLQWQTAEAVHSPRQTFVFRFSGNILDCDKTSRNTPSRSTPPIGQWCFYHQVSSHQPLVVGSVVPRVAENSASISWPALDVFLLQGQSELRNSPQQPISKSTGMNNAITPPLFTKSHMQYYPPSNYPGVSQLPTPTLSFNAGILRFKRPSDFLPQSLTPTPSSKSSSIASLSSTSNGGHNLPNSSKTRHDEYVNVNGEKDDEEGEGEGSPLGSREINRAVSQLEDVNPGTWSGRLSPTLPGMSTSNGHFYLTTALQRASLDPHLHNKQTSTSANHNDGDDKSIKSECLPGKDLNQPTKSLGIPPTLYSSESNLFTPDAWSNSLPNRPFHRAMKATTRESPSTLAQLRARADGREEVPTERIYGPLGFLKLPYDPPRSHTDHGEEPLEPRFKRRSWNAFPENPPLPYTVYTSVQEATLQHRRHQRCSSEAPTTRRVSTFLPDSNSNDDEVDAGVMEDAVEETTTSISPIPPIAVVKPTVGRIDGRKIHRPQPCYGLPALPSSSHDLLPPCMQMSAPEAYFNNLCSSSLKQPTASLPRRRTQLRRERAVPVARHSVFECPSVVDYGPLQNTVLQDLTLRRRARRHPEAAATAPVSRRRLFGSSAGMLPATLRPPIATEEEQSSTLMAMPSLLPPVCGRSERQGRSTRACLVANFEQSLANMAQRLQSLTVSAAEKDSELRELRQIIDSMVQERSFSGAVDSSSGKPLFPPSSTTNTNANAPVAAADVVNVEEEKSNSCPPGTPKSSGIRKGGWLRSSIDRAFRRRGSQSSLTGDTGSYGSHSKLAQPVAASAWNSPDHQTSPSLRKKFVRAASVSTDVNRTRGYPGNHLSNSCVGADGSRIVPTSPTSKSTSACCEAHSRCRLLEAEVETLRKELGERERRLTDAQLQALASAHQVDQLRDQLNLLFQQLSLLRSDNERLHASAAAAANTPHFSAE
ncbi:Neuron navigator 3 [Echinococcus granulosus]|uniref:Neuron navigator 3 n=1 Tax=Echinococcus granulosus TaxID=6210 RepID=W6UKP5_ECHGR|nr:Neuron navigator 3 [Echinococcus granulosus]EUB61736.1 Neuron navigator 3 [Echinococcus granulosus]